MNGSYFFTGFGCFRFISTLFYIYIRNPQYEDDAHERYYSSVTIRHVLRYSVYTEQPPGICSSDPDDFLLRNFLKFSNRTHHIRKI